MHKKFRRINTRAIWILLMSLLLVAESWAQSSPVSPVPSRILESEIPDLGLQSALDYLYPIGWSRDGKFAYAKRSFIRFIGDQYTIFIQDLVTDEVVWLWEGEAGVPLEEIWHEQGESIFEQLTRWQVDTTNQGSFSPGEYLQRDGREYQFEAMPNFETREFEVEGESIEEDVIWASEIIATSPQLGRKSVYSSGAVDGSRDVDVGVIGVISSPFEDRAAVIYAMETLDFELYRFTNFMIIGSHLTFGFQLDKSVVQENEPVQLDVRDRNIVKIYGNDSEIVDELANAEGVLGFNSIYALSPSGHSIAYVGWGEKGALQLYLYQSEHSEPDPIFAEGEIDGRTYIRWSPDDERFVFNQGERIWIYDPYLGRALKLSDPDQEYYEDTDPSFSDDGRTIYFYRGTRFEFMFSGDKYGFEIEGKGDVFPVAETGAKYPGEDLRGEEPGLYSVPQSADYDAAFVTPKDQLILEHQLFPIGWSDDGSFAYVKMQNAREEGCDCYAYHLIIQSLITDEILWEWSSGAVEEGLPSIWAQQREHFDKQLDRYFIWQEDSPPFFNYGNLIDIDGNEYWFQISNTIEKRAVKNPYDNESTTYSVHANSRVEVFSPFGNKKVFYKEWDEAHVVSDWVVGIFISPFEDRAAIVYVTQTLDWEHARVTDFHLIGAHLRAGFPARDEGP